LSATAVAPSQFKSNYKAMVIRARKGHKVYNPVNGAEMYDQEVKELCAEFGVHRGEFRALDEFGVEHTFGDICGFFYDLDADAEAKGWSADEKEIMRAHLIRKAESNPDFCQVYEPTPAERPWPAYDDAHHFSIPKLAIELGLAEQTLAYEQQNKNRDSIVEALQKALVPEEELAAV